MQATAVGSSYLAGGWKEKHKEKAWNYTSENQALLSWVGTSEERVPWSWFCKNWKNCKLDSAAPTGRTCHCQGEESVAAMTLSSRSGLHGAGADGKAQAAFSLSTLPFPSGTPSPAQLTREPEGGAGCGLQSPSPSSTEKGGVRSARQQLN